MRRPTIALRFALLLALTGTGALLGAGGGSVPAPPPAPQLTPEQQAAEAYNSGLSYRDKAWEVESELSPTATGKEREKAEKKVAKYFEKAAGQFERAVGYNPYLYQAHGSLGYALRRLGRYEQALGAYDRALELNPNYSEAIEYRAEAYLGLGRLAEAKAAHAQLTALDRVHADQLIEAMRAWLSSRRQDPQGIAASELDDFAGWLDQRGQLAEKTSTLVVGSQPW